MKSLSSHTQIHHRSLLDQVGKQLGVLSYQDWYQVSEILEQFQNNYYYYYYY